MGYYSDYIAHIGNQELVETINSTSYDVLQNIKQRQQYRNQINGLLLGNVQSGKTAQMLGVISQMADYGYRLFILLTTDNVELQKQTYNRVSHSLLGFNVLSERDEIKFAQEKLGKPMVIVLKKNSRVLKKWRNTLVNSNVCHGLFLSIFDDEADNASLNTLVNRNRQSSINRNIQSIKDTAVSTIYIEVTATPQAVLLQTEKSGWKPNFITYFEPGSTYLGGNFFYSIPQPFCVRFTDEYELDNVVADDDILCPKGLSDSIVSFLVICACFKLKGTSNCNFVIHPSSRISIHNGFVKTVQDHLTLLQKSTEEEGFENLVRDVWKDLQSTKPDIGAFEDILSNVIGILDNTEIYTFALNSKRDSDNPDLSKGFNIIVGGNTLGRGITFPHLQVVYYCRTSKKPQADTFWQHSRIFGYDRDGSLVRLFMPPSLFNLFAHLNKSNDILIRQIKENVGGIQLIYPKGIDPTRKNVLDEDSLKVVVGGVNMFASQPSGINTHTINNIIEQYADSEYVECDFDMIIKLLSLLPSENQEDFDHEKYMSCVSAISQSRPAVKCKLIVRIDRDISKGTGTLLSPNDRAIGDKFPQDIVLTLYRIVGQKDKGWSGKPFWNPNIKFPKDIVFFDTSSQRE